MQQIKIKNYKLITGGNTSETLCVQAIKALDSFYHNFPFHACTEDNFSEADYLVGNAHNLCSDLPKHRQIVVDLEDEIEPLTDHCQFKEEAHITAY